MITRLSFTSVKNWRFLSGYSGPPAKPKNLKTKKSELVAPAYQMGHKKPETGILEVETGRVIAGRKEVKIIESDEAYRSRIAEHKGLAKFESVRSYTPIFIILLLTLGYCISYDHFTEPPSAWVRKWYRNKQD